MKLNRIVLSSFILTLAVAPYPGNAALSTALPADLALPASSATARGFVVRTVQAPQDAVIGNNFVRALKQLDGTLADSAGALVPNEATPGPNPDGSYTVDTVNFERDGAPFDVVNVAGEVLTSFTPALFPGVPGTTGHADKFATEVVGFLDLSAGTSHIRRERWNRSNGRQRR